MQLHISCYGFFAWFFLNKAKIFCKVNTIFARKRKCYQIIRYFFQFVLFGCNFAHIFYREAVKKIEADFVNKVLFIFRTRKNMFVNFKDTFNYFSTFLDASRLFKIQNPNPFLDFGEIILVYLSIISIAKIFLQWAFGIP